MIFSSPFAAVLKQLAVLLRQNAWVSAIYWKRTLNSFSCRQAGARSASTRPFCDLCNQKGRVERSFALSRL
jgi:hypothetical protein